MQCRTLSGQTTTSHPHVRHAGQVTMKQGTAAKAVIRFGENVATHDFHAQQLDEMPLKIENEKVTVCVLVDRPMYELIGASRAVPDG